MMFLVGAALFFIPAPPMSLIGVGLIVVGAGLWLVDYFGGERRGRREMPREESRSGEMEREEIRAEPAEAR